MTKATIIGWWILVQVWGGSCQSEAPRAIGPYPSQEMCRLAGNKIMPDNKLFWTPAAVAEAEAKDRVEAERFKAQQEKERIEIAEIGKAIVAGKRKPGTIKLSSGASVIFDKDGKETGRDWGVLTLNSTGPGSGFIISGPFYNALTPCVEIKSEEVAK